MAEEKKDAFPWVQLIATIGTIVAALIGITPYILKLNEPPAAQTPTIVFVTFPPATTTPAPVTSAETTPAPTQTTILTTIATSGPPLTGNVTEIPTPVNTTVVTTPATPTLPPGPSIQIMVNTTSVPQGGVILASGSTDPAVPTVTITLKNSTTFQSAGIPVTLTQGAFQFQVDTAAYAPGDYTIYAAVPDTQAVAEAYFVITAV